VVRRGQPPSADPMVLGGPESVTHIGTGEMVTWMWFDNGNYSIEGEWLWPQLSQS